MYLPLGKQTAMEALEAMAHLATSCTGFQPQGSGQSHPKMKHPSVKHGPDVEISNKNPWFRAKGVFNMNGGMCFFKIIFSFFPRTVGFLTCLLHVKNS